MHFIFDNPYDECQSISVKRIKVFHIITSLLQDGAQHMLLRVVSNLDSSKFDLRVVNLRGPTPLSAEFEKHGFPVYNVDLKMDFSAPLRLFKMRKFIISEEPDILQGWMEHGNLCSTWFAKGCIKKPIVYWNIRRSLYNLKHDKLNTKIVLHLCKWLSSGADGIIFCAKEAMQHYRDFGFNLAKSHWIPNGFELNKFGKKLGAKRYVCAALGLPDDVEIVGNIGRYHPNKDHDCYLRAAKVVIEKKPNTHFVAIGRGVDNSNIVLTELTAQLGIAQNVHLIGPRTDLPDFIPGFSVFCLASRTEGFPNVVGEAMACEVPCVVTDSGATKELVEGIGAIVPKEDSKALAEALITALDRNPEIAAREGAAARARIAELYSLQSVVLAYKDLYLSENTSA